MSTASAEAFEAHRARLFGIAYRMLGEIGAAEDVVQEAWLRWQRAPADVAEPAAWLTTVVARLSLDQLRSARAQREIYVGPWLPEPLLEAGPDAGRADPAHAAELAESVSLAMLVVLERLSPLERAVFVLRDVFGYASSEVAAMLDRSDDSVRQLAARARAHVRANRPRFEADPARRDEAVAQFLAAAAGGDVDALVATLAEDAVLLSDGGGVVAAARRPIEGAERVARFLLGLVSRYLEAGAELEAAPVNGAPGFLVRLDGDIDSVVALDVVDGLVARIHTIRNPAKLAAARSSAVSRAEPRPGT